MSGRIVPGGGLAGMAGVESGSAAPLVGGPPGVELHTMVEEVPSGFVGAVVPVVLPTFGVEMVPNAAAVGAIMAMLPAVDAKTAVGTVDGVDGGGRGGSEGGGGAGTVEPGSVEREEVAGCADSARKGGVALLVADAADAVGATDSVGVDGPVPVATPVANTGMTGTPTVPGVICPDGAAQVTKVPGVAGLEASGTGANVVTGTPGMVVAENGLGPLSGDVTIVPGVDESPMAVVPMVETCARQAWAPSSRLTVVTIRRRIAIPSFATV